MDSKQSQSLVPASSVEARTDAVIEGTKLAVEQFLLKLGRTGCKLDWPQTLITEGVRRAVGDWLTVPENRKDFLTAISNQRTK
jgi:hypothetical protein